MGVTVRPTVDEERRVELADSARAWKRARLIDSAALEALQKHVATRWNIASLFARLGMFALGLLSVGALYGFLSVIRLPFEGFVAGAIAIGVAEMIIRKGRLFRSGIEEALWIGGAYAIISGLPGPERIEVLLLLAAASVFAGARVLNPIFVAIGLVQVLFYVGEKSELDALVAWIAIVLGVVAIAIAPRRFARPVWDQFVSLIVLGAVPIAYFTFAGESTWSRAIPAGIGPAELLAIVALGAYGLVTGVRRRTHPPLIAGLAAIVILGVEMRNLVPIADEAKLILAGGILFGAAFALERLLRDRAAGLTARRLTAGAFEPLPEILGGAILAPTGPATPEPAPGGQFGGGGASGEY